MEACGVDTFKRDLVVTHAEIRCRAQFWKRLYALFFSKLVIDNLISRFWTDWTDVLKTRGQMTLAVKSLICEYIRQLRPKVFVVGYRVVCRPFRKLVIVLF